MSGLIGKKIGMTSIFSEDGKNIPCTVIEAGPCKVLQIKTKDNDGYEAVQLGFKKQNAKRLSKALNGHLKKSKSEPLKKIMEVSPFSNEEISLGDNIPSEKHEWIC